MTVTEVDYLIVGAGPAGASLAAFMAQNGLKGICISKAPGTADTPRAHVFNPFALETLRDLGIEADARGHGVQGEAFKYFRWVRSIVGEEYGKVQAWGAHPDTQRDVLKASPCDYIDLPQSYLEPILLRYASSRGFHFKYSTELVEVHDVPGGSSTDTLCTLLDTVTQQAFQVRAKYVFGADGARSKVAQVLGLQYDTLARKGVAMNVLFRADLGHLMTIGKERWAGLHSVIQPDNFPGVVPLLRCIRPWNEWILVCNAPEENELFRSLFNDKGNPGIKKLIHQVIGDDSIDVEVTRLDPWTVRESVALTYSVEGKNQFILGDAAHRHPPAHANGSNTCVQDGYNLAWKVAYVAKGWAGQKLLDSYNDERQPVGATLVREANDQLRAHVAVWQALGGFAQTSEEGLRQLAELKEATPAGERRRRKLHEVLEEKRREGDNVGLSYNQWYVSSAVYLADEAEPRPALEGDPIVKIQISTYPGSRLPHAWLDLPMRRKEISTHDLAGHGAFTLFTGHGGEAWKKAADAITKATGIPIKAYGIGIGLDYIDVYRDWYTSREVEEDGCVVVRPDRFVAWRSKTKVSDAQAKLQQVIDAVLSRDGLQS
ncbi:FAD binding domain-containing protein [Xylariaceae sp. FL0594]|nr:FAD binding domain-containing protein [Xylariaceae sp. FL0594]